MTILQVKTVHFTELHNLYFTLRLYHVIHSTFLFVIQYSIHCSVQCSVQGSVNYCVDYTGNYNLQEAGKRLLLRGEFLVWPPENLQNKTFFFKEV